MGYRKLSDGTWEQPAQAETRLVARQIKHWIISGAIGLSAACMGVGGAYLLGTSSTLDREEQTDHDKVLGGLFAIVAAAGTTLVGAAAMSGRHARDAQSLEQVRFDKQRGARVVEGHPVDPEHLATASQEGDKATRIFAARQPV